VNNVKAEPDSLQIKDTHRRNKLERIESCNDPLAIKNPKMIEKLPLFQKVKRSFCSLGERARCSRVDEHFVPGGATLSSLKKKIGF